MRKFPSNFYWGTATSAHQVEGGNNNSDWWAWEIKAAKARSGEACRQYDLYRQDFDIAKQLNHNCHRLSVEWARIEPREGVFEERELDHYRGVIQALVERGLEPVVTLHHFTNPVWFVRRGGWTNSSATGLFLRYCQRVVEALGENVRFWVTINEPMVYVYQSYFLGAWPPQERSALLSIAAAKTMAQAHIQAYRLIHRLYGEKGLDAPRVGIAHNLQAFVAYDRMPATKLGVYLRDKLYNFAILDLLIDHKSLDYIGINYYTRGLVKPQGWSLRALLTDNAMSNLKKNSLGWEIYPEGLYELLLRLKKYRLPVFILENGICTDDDVLRWEYIHDHLACLLRAMDKGVRVLGYLYWSLIDNFEWDKGFAPRFGLVEVDYTTYARRVRESAVKFSKVCADGVLDAL